MITIVLTGNYYKPHLVMRIGNAETRMHSEPYATRSSGQRAQKTLVRRLGRVARYDKVVAVDETYKRGS